MWQVAQLAAWRIVSPVRERRLPKAIVESKAWELGDHLILEKDPSRPCLVDLRLDTSDWVNVEGATAWLWSSARPAAAQVP